MQGSDRAQATSSTVVLCSLARPRVAGLAPSRAYLHILKNHAKPL